MNSKQFGAVGLVIILLLVSISIIAYVMANGSSPIGPSPEIGSNIAGTDDGQLVVQDIAVINAGERIAANEGSTGEYMLSYDPAIRIGKPVNTFGTSRYTKPGIMFTNVVTVIPIADAIYYQFFYTNHEITITQLSLNVTTAGTVGSTCRLGIYDVDSSWQPVNLVADAGLVAVDTIGVKIGFVATGTIDAGAYATAIICNGNPTLATFLGGYQGMIDNSLSTTSIVIQTATINQTFERTIGLSNPAVGWASVITGSTAPRHFVMTRVESP